MKKEEKLNLGEKIGLGLLVVGGAGAIALGGLKNKAEEWEKKQAEIKALQVPAIDFTDSGIPLANNIDESYENIQKCFSNIILDSKRAYAILNDIVFPENDLKYGMLSSLSNLSDSYSDKNFGTSLAANSMFTASMMADILQNIPNSIDRQIFMAAFNIVAAKQYLNTSSDVEWQNGTATAKELPTLKAEAQLLDINEGEEEKEIYRIVEIISKTTGIGQDVLTMALKIILMNDSVLYGNYNRLYEGEEHKNSILPEREGNYFGEQFMENLEKLNPKVNKLTDFTSNTRHSTSKLTEPASEESLSTFIGNVASGLKEKMLQGAYSRQK